MDPARPDSREHNQSSLSQPPNNDGAADVDTTRRASAEDAPASTSNVPSSEEQQHPAERVDPYADQVQNVITSDVGDIVLDWRSQLTCA